MKAIVLLVIQSLLSRIAMNFFATIVSFYKIRAIRSAYVPLIVVLLFRVVTSRVLQPWSIAEATSEHASDITTKAFGYYCVSIATISNSSHTIT